MKILALDSSGLVASVAVTSDDVLLGEYTICYKKTHSQTLLPMLSQLRDMLGIDLRDIDAIAVASGPGSFTGLRIGASTAKGLAFALDKPIVPVPTTDAMAFDIFGFDGIICPLMDARRMQTYSGLYSFDSDGSFNVIRAACATSADEIISDINLRGQRVALLGDGVPVFRELLEDRLRVEHVYSPSHLSRQRAGAVASLGAIYYERGQYVSHDMFHPEYLRMSQAERERQAAEEQCTISD